MMQFYCQNTNRRELILESVCACAKFFVDEGNVHMAQVESWKNKNIDGFYTKTTQVYSYFQDLGGAI
jgi:hypothetical protein